MNELKHLSKSALFINKHKNLRNLTVFGTFTVSYKVTF